MAAKRPTISADLGVTLNSKNKNIANLQAFLTQFGYLPPGKAHKKSSLLAAVSDTFPGVSKPQVGVFDEATELALKTYQAFHGLPPTGKLDMGTEAEMNRPRCGFPDRPGGGDRVGSFVLAGSKWPKTSLTFQISKFSNSQISQDDIGTAMEAALSLWGQVTPLTFTATQSGPDINIRFEVRNHGDGNSFDGPLGILAHAFFPTDGRTHFDDDEDWRVEFPPSGDGIDLITVAAHEFGHALGLEHSSVRGSLMFPTYQGPHRFLAVDDINGIRALYGAS